MNTVENVRLDKMEEKLNQLECKVDQVEGKVDQVEGKVDKILNALTGDTLRVDKGLIAEHKDTRDRVLKLETFNSKVIWIGVGAGIAAGLSLNKIIEWIQLAGQ